MKRLLILLLVIAAVGLALAPGAQAATRHGGISGVVVDAHGNSVAGAVVTVSLRTLSGHTFHARTQTDHLGHFRLRTPAGRGVVEAEHHGATGRVRVAVRPGHVTRVRVLIQ